MQITLINDDNAKDVDITITCNKTTSEIEKIIATLRMFDKQLTGKKDNKIFLIPVKEIIYIESIDRKCFFYTADSFYETDFKLYELEEQLRDIRFFRINKSMIINLMEVCSLKSEINRRILVTMCNGEQIIASRQYADELKKELGVK